MEVSFHNACDIRFFINAHTCSSVSSDSSLHSSSCPKPRLSRSKSSTKVRSHSPPLSEHFANSVHIRKQCSACRRTHTRRTRSRRWGTTSASMFCAGRLAKCRRCTSTKVPSARRRTLLAGMEPHERVTPHPSIFYPPITQVKLYHTLRYAPDLGHEALHVFIPHFLFATKRHVCYQSILIQYALYHL